MRKIVEATVLLKGQHDLVIAPGDSIDLYEHGVIVWLNQEDAEVWRLERAKQQRELRATIERVSLRHRLLGRMNKDDQ